MRIEDAIEHLNDLTTDSVKGQVPLRTTEELRDFFSNPPKRPYSVPLEEAMTTIVKMFGEADEDGRRAITSKLNADARRGFLGYAATMAVLAVRLHSPTLVEQGLIALVIEGASSDSRDSIVALAKLYHSAVKLGMSAEKVFKKAASLAEPGIIRSEMQGFPLRQPGDRDLKAFYQTEETTEEGFRYKQVLPWSAPQVTSAQTSAGPAETTQQISARLNWDQQQALIRMAGIQAAMAVRKQSPKLVEQGLQGLALGGGGLDPRHSLAALAQLHHSALKLGMDAKVAFLEAAEFAPPGDLKTEMINFPLRKPEDRELAAFNLQEETTKEGFGYRVVAKGDTEEAKNGQS
jgi:hypothetical protein